MDKLDNIFKLQDILNSKFKLSVTDMDNMSEEERVSWVRNYTTVAIMEAGEVLKACGERWWKKDKDWKGMQDVQEEIIDLLHFVLCSAMAAGMNSETLHERYILKNKRNHTREDWAVNSDQRHSS